MASRAAIRVSLTLDIARYDEDEDEDDDEENDEQDDEQDQEQKLETYGSRGWCRRNSF